MDYLYAREEEGLGASIPLAVMKSVQWFEVLVEVEEGIRISSQPFVTLVVRELTRKLESNAPRERRGGWGCLSSPWRTWSWTRYCVLQAL